MRTKPDQKKVAIILVCIFLVVIIAFVILWTVKFKNSEQENSTSDEAEQTTYTEPQEPEQPETAEIKVTELNATMYSASPELTIRAMPDAESEIIETVNAGDGITVTGVCENGWYQVKSGESVGYCFGKYLSETKKDAPQITKSDTLPYYITINCTQNTVTVYEKDSAGEYTVPLKAMVCSVGREGHETPQGTYKLSDKYTWACLSGNVWGQYVTRITGPYLFHSVPYFSEKKSDLEYEEYNKLGEAASLGCVRLAVVDAKWIYDNCPKGTSVTIYESDKPEPLPRPEPITIDPADERRGWDPTDPDPKNPWKQ